MQPRSEQDRDRAELFRLWGRWREMTTAIARPDVELTAEEFVPLLLTFKRLRSLGIDFDAALIALMKCLERQLFDGADDGDSDNFDADLE